MHAEETISRGLARAFRDVATRSDRDVAALIDWAARLGDLDAIVDIATGANSDQFGDETRRALRDAATSDTGAQIARIVVDRDDATADDWATWSPLLGADDRHVAALTCTSVEIARIVASDPDGASQVLARNDSDLFAGLVAELIDSSDEHLTTWATAPRGSTAATDAVLAASTDPIRVAHALRDHAPLHWGTHAAIGALFNGRDVTDPATYTDDLIDAVAAAIDVAVIVDVAPVLVDALPTIVTVGAADLAARIDTWIARTGRTSGSPNIAALRGESLAAVIRTADDDTLARIADELAERTADADPVAYNALWERPAGRPHVLRVVAQHPKRREIVETLSEADRTPARVAELIAAAGRVPEGSYDVAAVAAQLASIDATLVEQLIRHDASWDVVMHLPANLLWSSATAGALSALTDAAGGDDDVLVTVAKMAPEWDGGLGDLLDAARGIHQNAAA